MKKKVLTLERIKVQSFVTNLKKESAKTVIGMGPKETKVGVQCAYTGALGRECSGNAGGVCM